MTLGSWLSHEATDHVARDHVGFVEFCRIPIGSRNITMGNEASVEVLGIDTYKLDVQGGRTLLLHDEFTFFICITETWFPICFLE